MLQCPAPGASCTDAIDGKQLTLHRRWASYSITASAHSFTVLTSPLASCRLRRFGFISAYPRSLRRAGDAEATARVQGGSDRHTQACDEASILLGEQLLSVECLMHWKPAYRLAYADKIRRICTDKATLSPRLLHLIHRHSLRRHSGPSCQPSTLPGTPPAPQNMQSSTAHHRDLQLLCRVCRARCKRRTDHPS